MKSIEEYLNESANELLESESFINMVESLWRNEDIHWGIENIKKVVSKAMQECAKQCCDEQIKACHNMVTEHYSKNIGIEPCSDTINEILNTPNVVTTK